jgi:hypothetical protein
MQSVRQWFYYLIYLWWRLMFALGVYARPIHQKSFIEENSEYINPIKSRFLLTFESEASFDENIDPLFYNKKEYTEHMTDTKNTLEPQWKKRILIENTPRGNIIMYYDAYKLAFAFYCDQKVVSYDVLNAVAMKYVIHFRCRHFFLDEFIVPKENLSPFIKLYFTEEAKPKQITDTKKTFAKLRDYTKDHPNAKKSNTSSPFGSLIPFFQSKPEAPEEKSDEPEKKKNTFLYLGKTNNFQILQAFPKPKRVLAKFTSPLLEGLDTSIKRENLSYRSFRNLKEKVQPPPPPEEPEPVAESNEI